MREKSNLFNKCLSLFHGFVYFFFSFSLIFNSIADNFRPYLTSFQGNAFTDYINAVFVDVSMHVLITIII